MAGAAERFRQAASAAGLSLQVRRFPEGTKTAGDAARAVGCHLGQIVKSLVFVADGVAFLALTSGSNRADTARLAALMATPDAVFPITPHDLVATSGGEVAEFKEQPGSGEGRV